MTFITASRIHDGKKWLPENAVIEVSSDGTIQQIHDRSGIPPENIKSYDGVLCPGFINVHGHLELSHLKGKIPEAEGLIPFIRGVVSRRAAFSDEEKQDAIVRAVAELKKNGIVAIGDIANGTDTLAVRLQSGLHMHTFVETLGFTEERAAERFSFSEGVYNRFAAQRENGFLLRQSIVPHAPYSISEKLFHLINDAGAGQVISIHNQETPAENEWYRTKTGALQSFYDALSIDPAFFHPSGKTSLQTYLPWLNKAGRLILVHNTFMSEEDILFLKAFRKDTFICLCPGANWYIERCLPPVALMDTHELDICLGTDSLASNYQLSILSEIQLIRDHFPDISWEKLLQWGTWNGARALGLEAVAGTLTPGKKPGILLLSGAQYEQLEVLF